MTALFHLFFYNPLYNGLVFLLAHLPGHDIGVAVILFTAFVKLLLFPLSKKAVVTQMKLKEIAPELDRLKEKNKNNKEAQAKEMMLLYKNNKINPFSGLLLAIIQIPIILALYFIFLKGGFNSIDTSILYSFVKIPEFVTTHFLGLLDVSKPQLILGIIAGVSQYIQVQYSVPAIKKVENPGFKDDLARSMNVQMRYVLPFFVFLISFRVSGAVALYWITGNLFTIGQELYMRKHLEKNKVTSSNSRE